MGFRAAAMVPLTSAALLGYVGVQAFDHYQNHPTVTTEDAVVSMGVDLGQ